MKIGATLMSLFVLAAPSALAHDCEELNDCMGRTEIRSTDALPDYRKLQALALLNAGHAGEAIPIFEQLIKESHPLKTVFFPGNGALFLNAGKAYDALGNDELAIWCYKAGDMEVTIVPLVKLLVKVGQAKEAKSLCDQAFNTFSSNLLISESKMCALHEIRAEAEVALGDLTGARDDFRSAAQIYLRIDSDKLTQCLEKAHHLLGSEANTISVSEKDLPCEDKESVLKLIQLIYRGQNNFGAENVDSITGSSIMPADRKYEHKHTQGLKPAFGIMSFASSNENAAENIAFETTLDTKKCALPRASVLSTLPPSDTNNRPIFDKYTGRELVGGERWLLPKGNLILVFAQGGLHILEEIRWEGHDSERRCNCASDASKAADYARIKLTERDYNAALKASTRAIKIGENQRVPLPSAQRCQHLLLRADIYEAQKKWIAATTDIETVYQLQGAYYLPRLISCLVKADRSKTAIDLLLEALKKSTFERERSLLHLYLAKMYFDSSDWKEAISHATYCLESEDKQGYEIRVNEPPYMYSYRTKTERMSAPARVIRAAAEAKLGQYKEARADAQRASDQYFEIARIECRDKLRSWLKQLPAEN